MAELIATKEELEHALSLFKGQRCWNVLSCDIGTSLNFNFGGALETFQYTEKGIPQKNFQGQFDLLIFCSWRLDNEKHDPIACSTRSAYDEIKTTMVSLIDDTIDSILLYPPICEATVLFSSGKSLRIFSDEIPSFDTLGNISHWTNWLCATENNVYYIETEQEIYRKEERLNPVSGAVLTLEQVDFSTIPSDRDYVPSTSQK